MVGIRVGSGVGSVSGALPWHSRVLDVGRCPPPNRGRGDTLKAGVMLCMPLEPLAKVSSGGGEGDIRVVCNDEGGFSVGRLHGRAQAERGLNGRLWIMKIVIAIHVAVPNVGSPSRACWARPLRGAMACPWPSVAVCPSHRLPMSSVENPHGGFRPGIGQVPLGEWGERKGYAHVWV